MRMDSVYEYVAKARSRGLDDEAIRTRLSESGWRAEDISRILSDDLIPPPPPYSGQRTRTEPDDRITSVGAEWFLTLLAMGISAIAVAVILHALVNTVFDSGDDVYRDMPTFSVAVMIVVLPVFVFLYLRVRRAEAVDPGQVRNAGRRRSLQIAIVASFVIAVGRLGAFVAAVLNGRSLISDAPLSTNLAHMIVTVGISGSILLWSYAQLRRGEEEQIERPSAGRAVGFAVLVVVIAVSATVAQSVLTADSREDQQLAEDLQAVSWAVEEYARDNYELPESLEQVELDPLVEDRTSDVDYRIVKTAEDNPATERNETEAFFELCADFKTDTTRGGTRSDDEWSFNVHRAGRHCFEREVFIQPKPVPTIYD